MEARVIDTRKLPGRHLTEGPKHALTIDGRFSGGTRGFCIGVGPALKGAVTHPGGAAETVSYADL
jgi:hypothetical protein